MNKYYSKQEYILPYRDLRRPGRVEGCRNQDSVVTGSPGPSFRSLRHPSPTLLGSTVLYVDDCDTRPRFTGGGCKEPTSPASSEDHRKTGKGGVNEVSELCDRQDAHTTDIRQM